MRFQTRLMILLLVGTLLSTAAMLSLFEYYSYQPVLREMRAKALAIAATAATQIDAELHQQARSPNDEVTEAYKTIREQLRRIRDANRRDDSFVKISLHYHQIS